MASPVWVLSVDLQAKTATFTTGLADAAKKARGAFTDIGSGASGMAGEVSGASTNVRAALGLIDNTIRGNHAAAMADLVREFKDSSLVMGALPFAATIGGIAAIAAIAVEVAAKIVWADGTPLERGWQPTRPHVVKHEAARKPTSTKE